MSFRVRLAVTAFIILWVCVAQSLSAAQAQPETSGSPVAAANTFPQPAGWPAILRASRTQEPLGPGVAYEHWQLLTANGPLEISIATVDLRNPSVSLAAASHQGIVAGGDERLAAMGDRLHAELGINADYFDINESGAPLNILAQNGRILHQPDAAAAFVVQAGNRILMQPVVWHATVTSASGTVHEVSAVNEWSSASALSLLTPELGRGDASGAVEIVFTPQAASGDDQAQTFRVRTVVSNAANLAGLNAGELALAARGAQAQGLLQDFSAGDSVTVQLTSDPPLPSIQMAIGGGPVLLKDGAYVSDPAAPAPEETNVRNPVTAAGIDAAGTMLWLVVVDGRAPGLSVGLTRPMLAALLQSLGASTAMAFDSGGSSEMAVRHLGDAGLSVANTPSDGRERSIADGLFVVNNATPGPPQQLIVRAPATNLLAGSHLQLFASAVDANQQPVALAPPAIHYSVSPASVAAVDATGLMAALAPGAAAISVDANGIRSDVRVQIVPQVSNLTVQSADRMVPLGSRLALSAAARTADGSPIALDPGQVRWESRGSGGAVDGAGVFTGARHAGVSTVTARAGGTSASLVLFTGDHALAIQDRLHVAAQPPGWHFRAQPVGAGGGLAEAAAPSGDPALRLQYDFNSPGVTRAAYAESAIVVCGQPLAVSLEVYGDGHGEWLRAGYRNADGNNESLTLARHVDWLGWRSVRASVPHQASWPIVWTRFYVVERGTSAREQGTLWLRNFSAIYAGPASVGCNAAG